MRDVERYCSNCRAELPAGADSCPACGVFAGDVFDGTWPRKQTNTRLWLILLALALLAAAGAIWFERSSARTDGGPRVPVPSTRVVSDRPGGSRRARGAKVTEAEAVRLLRRRVVEEKSIANDCIAVIGERDRPDYSFNVFDSCARVRLGRWRVDPKSGEVSLVRPR